MLQIEKKIIDSMTK